MTIFRNRIVAVGAGAAILAVAGSTGAVAAGMIGSADIKDESIRSVDVRDGILAMKDLRPGVAKHFDNAGVNARVAALMDRVETLEADVDALQGEDESGGVNTNWVANEGATIVDANTVTVKNEGTAAGSSVEIQNLDLPVQATKTISFTYTPNDGAVYGAGSPRVFIEVGGNYLNTHDAAPADAGVDNGDGTFTKTWTITENGRVGNAGVVMDSGSGSFTITDLVISGHSVQFSG